MTNIVAQFPAEQPIYGLQAVGLHPNYEPDLTIEEMAARYVQAIQRVQPSGPYHLGGFCFGGVLAYEIACQLEQIGQKSALLAIIEGSAPRQYHVSGALYTPQRLQVIRHSAPHFLRGNEEFGGWQVRKRIKRLFHTAGPALSSPHESNWEVEFDNIADFNATRPEIQHALHDINVSAIENYTPQSYNGRVTLFRAKYLRLRHALFSKIDPSRGWSALAQKGVDIHYIDGYHTGILKQPYAVQLAAALTTALETSNR